MKSKCFFCDRELEVVVHTFKIGLKEEAVCEECHAKTENRRLARSRELGSGSG